MRPVASRWLVLLAAALAETLALAPAAAAHPLEVVRSDHWAYKALYRMAARDLVPLWAASARPLTRMELARMVATALDRVPARRDRMTREDLEVLEALVLEFADEMPLNGYAIVNPPRPPSAQALTGWGLRVDRAAAARVEAGQPWWIARPEGSSLRLEVRATLGLGASLAVGTDVRKGLTWGDDPSDGLQRLYVVGESRGATLQVGRDALWWGPGWRGAYLLSDYSGPFDAARLSFTWNRLRFTKIVAPACHEGRVLYGMRYDWLARDGLRVGLSETVLGGGSLYSPYVFNPIPGLNYALSLWDRGRRQGQDDNFNVGIDFDWRIRPGIVAYGEILFDDIAFGTVLGFGRPDPHPHRLGGLVGLYVANPFGIGWTELRLEHSRVRNWVYTTRGNRNDYARGGRPLGHWCAPDCELWSAVVIHRLAGGASTEVADAAGCVDPERGHGYDQHERYGAVAREQRVDRLERRYRENAAAYFQRIDVVVFGRRRETKAETYLLAEVSSVVDRQDVERARLLERAAGLPVVAAVAGERITPGAKVTRARPIRAAAWSCSTSSRPHAHRCFGSCAACTSYPRRRNWRATSAGIISSSHSRTGSSLGKPAPPPVLPTERRQVRVQALPLVRGALVLSHQRLDLVRVSAVVPESRLDLPRAEVLQDLEGGSAACPPRRPCGRRRPPTRRGRSLRCGRGGPPERRRTRCRHNGGCALRPYGGRGPPASRWVRKA